MYRSYRARVIRSSCDVYASRERRSGKQSAVFISETTLRPGGTRIDDNQQSETSHSLSSDAWMSEQDHTIGPVGPSKPSTRSSARLANSNVAGSWVPVRRIRRSLLRYLICIHPSMQSFRDSRYYQETAWQFGPDGPPCSEQKAERQGEDPARNPRSGYIRANVL